MTPSGDDEIIGGVNPVIELLKDGRRPCDRIWIAESRGGPALKTIFQLARSGGVKVERTDRRRIDRMFGGPGHQGVVARVGAYQYAALDDILKRAGSTGLLLAVDGVEDPGNLGSLIRSAAAAGADGVIIPKDRAAPVTPAVLKASAGAAQTIPVAREVNLARALDQAKDQGFWVIGLAGEAEICLYDVDLPVKAAVVVGGENRGLRRLIRERCDLLASLPLADGAQSLNAAVAGALALYEIVRRKRLDQS
jgi:23S rRNA (guanosine2251-2'-O)-methyltransferase